MHVYHSEEAGKKETEAKLILELKQFEEAEKTEIR